MRVSTNTVFEQGVYNILRGQAQLIKTQDQISTGRRVLSPSDDPVASSRALEVSQSKSVNAQFNRNSESAQAAISLQEESLNRYTSLLQDVKTLAVNAGNGALTQRELKSLAAELRGRYEELLGIANTTDSNGLYLFSGFQGNTLPFTENSPGVVAYNGDEGTRLVQVGPARDIPVSNSGAEVFQKIRNGNGTFVTAAAGTNTGTGVVTQGVVRNEAAWNTAGNPKNFEVRFHVDSTVIPPRTTYDIVDTVNGVSLLTGGAPAAGPHTRTYQTGAAISLSTQTPPDTNPTAFDYGIELSVTGTPADGDAFTVEPSATQDVFTTMYNLITAMENTGAGATENTRLTNSLNTALTEIDNALDVNLRVLAAVGSYSKELDVNREVGEDLNLQFDKMLSSLQDLDYASAITQLTYQQISLDAAQKSFMQVQQLSLFELL
ncbi:MAG: flagellar hook-associated protein FlgL [Betaproteobacteria bacterium]|nr:flagellar hook-associated protein FlgL [Betaproteobacteria bacterium]